MTNTSSVILFHVELGDVTISNAEIEYIVILKLTDISTSTPFNRLE